MKGISYLVIDSIRGNSFEAYPVLDIYFGCCIQIILGYQSEFCYVELCDFDRLKFYVYMFYGVLFSGPQF